MTRGSYSDERDELTRRMVDYLRAASLGESAAETARRFHVSEDTVRGVRAAALARLGARNVVEAVAILIRRGDL